MSGLQDQSEHCEKCNKSFSCWDTFMVHKIESKKHICCLFCGRDFNTLEGCSRHQRQNHSAEQNLSCTGCSEKFNRAGSYINHIELQMCPVIHHKILEAKRVEKEKLLLSESGQSIVPYKTSQFKSATNPSKEGIPSSLGVPDDGPLKFPEPAKKTSWDNWGGAEIDNEKFPALSLENFPVLPLQDYRNGGSKVPDLLTGTPEELTEEHTTGFAQKEFFPVASKPADVQRPATATFIDPVTKIEKFHEFDPDNPKFDARRFYIPILEKFRCPWNSCRKSLNNRMAFIQHLRSPAHTDLRLRCPACMRQYPSATALVQHAESQAVKCQIRESQQYKSAVDCITGGFVDTEGRHKDYTVRYIARPDAMETGQEGMDTTLKVATNAFRAEEEMGLEMCFKGMLVKPDW